MYAQCSWTGGPEAMRRTAAESLCEEHSLSSSSDEKIVWRHNTLSLTRKKLDD